MKKILVISKKPVENPAFSKFLDVDIIYIVFKNKISEIPEPKGISGILFWEDMDASEIGTVMVNIAFPNISAARIISKSLTPSAIKRVQVYEKIESAINFLLKKPTN